MTETFPLSHPISAGDVPPDGETVTFSADETERKALADTFDLDEIRSLDVSFLIKPWRGDGLSVAGTVDAVVVQPCVVTLAPVRQTIRETVDLHFLPEARVREDVSEVSVDPTGEDPPDVFDGDSLDLGAIAAEHVALGIDPYPRAPGARFDPREAGVGDKEPSPFAVLEKLKRGGDQ
ncbi:DUF177 domain-containing protein [Amorphus sp. 3PC139-8]|uniref:YceD family protein n=1 Tax=Amorphus sp. 3PC139-8 TaxID=2735676 RepID=UPI00345D7361